MRPQDRLRSEQAMQMNMLCLTAVHDETLNTGGFSEQDEVYNMIEVITDEVEFSRIERYLPQTNTFVDDSNFYTLCRGIYLGYFQNISVQEGIIRIIKWS